MGVRVLSGARVTNVSVEHEDHDIIDSVTISQYSKDVSIHCNNLVIAAGPWSQRVLASLFPAASYGIPMNVTHEAGTTSVQRHHAGSQKMTAKALNSSTSETYWDIV